MLLDLINHVDRGLDHLTLVLGGLLPPLVHLGPFPHEKDRGYVLAFHLAPADFVPVVDGALPVDREVARQRGTLAKVFISSQHLLLVLEMEVELAAHRFDVLVLLLLAGSAQVLVVFLAARIADDFAYFLLFGFFLPVADFHGGLVGNELGGAPRLL